MRPRGQVARGVQGAQRWSTVVDARAGAYDDTRDPLSAVRARELEDALPEDYGRRLDPRRRLLRGAVVLFGPDEWASLKDWELRQPMNASLFSQTVKDM